MNAALLLRGLVGLLAVARAVTVAPLQQGALTERHHVGAEGARCLVPERAELVQNPSGLADGVPGEVSLVNINLRKKSDKNFLGTILDELAHDKGLNITEIRVRSCSCDDNNNVFCKSVQESPQLRDSGFRAVQGISTLVKVIARHHTSNVITNASQPC